MERIESNGTVMCVPAPGLRVMKHVDELTAIQANK